MKKVNHGESKEKNRRDIRQDEEREERLTNSPLCYSLSCNSDKTKRLEEDTGIKSRSQEKGREKERGEKEGGRLKRQRNRKRGSRRKKEAREEEIY